MSETLLDELRRKLGQAFAVTWEHEEGMDVVLDDGTALDPASGALDGGMSFRVRTHDGAWHIVHREQIENVRDSVALDDVVARGLSLFLMKHPTWPR
jgi:hypothetical protein